jgi:hypothetical protein
LSVPVSERTGEPEGVNFTLITQVPRYATEPEHVLPLAVEKSDPLVPEYVGAVNVTDPPVLFVTVTARLPLGLPCRTAPNASDPVLVFTDPPELSGCG